MSNFIDALEKNDIDQCEVIIRNGLPVDSLNTEGETLLYHVMQKGNSYLFKLLLMAEAPLTKDGLTLLMHAIIENDELLVSKLIEMGVAVNKSSKEGETALMIAAAMGNLAIVKMLLLAESNIELKNKRNQTALDIAIAEKETDIIYLLSKTIQ